MLPQTAIEACKDSPILTGFLEAVALAFDEGASYPAKHRLDVVRLGRKGVLPYTWIMERGADGRFRFRLVGEEIVRNFGESPRGKTLEEVLDEAAVNAIHASFEAALEDRAIRLVTGPVYRGGRYYYDARRLLVPMCDPGGDPRFVVCCFERLETDETARVEPGVDFRFSRTIVFPLSGAPPVEETGAPVRE